MNRRRYLATTGVTASALTFAGCLGNRDNPETGNTDINDSDDTETDINKGNLFAETNGQELTWSGDCPPADYNAAEELALTLSEANYTVETEPIGTSFQTLRGEQESEGASGLYSINDEIPLRIRIDIWDAPEIATNVAKSGVARLGTLWRGEDVTFEAGILAHIPDSPVTADFYTLNNDYNKNLVKFYLTTPCFTPEHVVATSWN